MAGRADADDDTGMDVGDATTGEPGAVEGEGGTMGDEIDEEPKKRRAVDPNIRVLILRVLAN